MVYGMINFCQGEKFMQYVKRSGLGHLGSLRHCVVGSMTATLRSGLEHLTFLSLNFFMIASLMLKAFYLFLILFSNLSVA